MTPSGGGAADDRPRVRLFTKTPLLTRQYDDGDWESGLDVTRVQARAQIRNPNRNPATSELVQAVMAHDHAASARLLDLGANVNARDERGHTLLMLAAGGGTEELVDLLLARGAQTEDQDHVIPDQQQESQAASDPFPQLWSACGRSPPCATTLPLPACAARLDGAHAGGKGGASARGGAAAGATGGCQCQGR
jgi:ankyrin repeat protein